MSESLEKESIEEADSQKLTEAKDGLPEIVEDESNQFIELFSVEDKVELENGDSYEILAVIGRGGMGQVYKARNCQTEELVAIKTLNKDLQDDKAALKRFQLEATTAKELNHKNLATVYEFETTIGGDSVIIMEYVSGENLREVLDSSGEMKALDSLDLFIQLASGMSYAHKNGIIHRDLKPSNVILGDKSSDDVKVLDFGIAKVDSISSRETQDLTRTGGVFGSPYYMSPEQCLGFRLDQRSDIYSLGCLMYEVVSGEPPFAGSNPMQLVVSHINENPPRLSRQFRDKAKASKIENVIFRCLAKEQSDRYQSMDDLKHDLELIKADKEIPKYETKKNIKAAYSLTSITYVLAAICLVVLVGSVFPGDTLPREFWFYLQGVACTVLSIIGSYVCLNIFKEKFKALENATAKLKDWFALLFVLFSGLSASVLTPFMLTSYFSYRESIPLIPGFTLDGISIVLFCTLAIASVTVFLALLSGICRFIFKGGKKVSAGKPVAILFVLALIVAPIIPQIAPKAVTGLTYRLAWTSIRTAPQRAIDLYNYSFKLDPRKGLPFHLASIYDQNDDLKSAIKIVTKYMDVYRGKDTSLYHSLLAERAFLYDRDGQYNSALRDARYLVQNSPEKRSLAYAVIANVESKQKNSFQALKSIDRAIAVDPSYTNYAYPVKIGILCQYGQYDQALSLINRIEDRSSFRINWYCASGIIYDKMGRKDLAENAFRESYKQYKYLLKAKEEKMHNFRTPKRDERLAGAYAAFKLGKVEESEKLLQKASDFEFPPKKNELVDRLFNYSWDLQLPW